MKIVSDNNVFFSLMNPNSVASYIFSMPGFEFYAPDNIKSELEEHKEECLLKSRLSKYEFEMRMDEMEQKIKLADIQDYKQFLKKALDSITDEDDAPYLASALMLNSAIWSNDSHLKKQNLVKVYTTEDLINILLDDTI